MTDRTSIPAGKGSTRLIILAALALLLVPVTGRAENSIRHSASEAQPAPALQAVHVTGVLPMRQDAVDTFMVRFGDISLSVNCGMDDSPDRLRERSELQSPVKTVAALGNLSVKVGFAF